jgi:hypothetical protein
MSRQPHRLPDHFSGAENFQVTVAYRAADCSVTIETEHYPTLQQALDGATDLCQRLGWLTDDQTRRLP